MGLFDVFKKTPTVRCTQCGVQIKETDAHRYQGGVYCSICYGRQDFGGGGKGGIRIDIPEIPHKKNTAKQGSEAKGMPAAIQNVKAEFDSAGIKCLSGQFGNQWEVHAGVDGKGVTYTMKFISKISDSNDLALRIFNLIQAPAEKRREVLALLSQLQTRYRFWRFNLDSSNNINVEYDFPPATRNHGKMAVEMFLRTMKMVDDIYPELSKCVWKTPVETRSSITLGGRKVRMVMERKPQESGAACLCMMFDYYGKYISLEQACLDCNMTENGIAATDLMRAVKRQGRPCHGYKSAATDLKRLKVPVIIYCQKNHFVVLDRIQGEEAYINDPARGRISISFAELQRLYAGIVIVMEDPT